MHFMTHPESHYTRGEDETYAEFWLEILRGRDVGVGGRTILQD